MATYTPPTISNYNDTPPTNDGSEDNVNNLVDWDRHIDEIGDPLNNYIDAVNTETDAAFDRIDDARWVSVTDYGATGVGANDAPAIQAAIDAVEAAGGGVVFFPKGNYGLTATLTITGDEPVQLRGEGVGSKITNSTTGGNAITIGNVSTQQSERIIISNLWIIGTAVTGHGIQVLREQMVMIEDCLINFHGGDGIAMSGCYAIYIYHNRISSNFGSGITHIGISTAGIDWTRIEQNAILANAVNGITLDCSVRESAGVRVINNDIEGNVIGIECIVGSGGNSEAWAIDYNYFENQSGRNLKIGADGGTGFYRAMSIANNIFNPGSPSVPATNAVELDNIQAGIIRNNVFAFTDVTVQADSNIGLWAGNTNSGGTVPAGFPNDHASVEKLYIRQSSTTVSVFEMGSNQMRGNFPIACAAAMYPGTAITGSGYQTSCGLWAGAGAPNVAVGVNNDFYFRGDGGAGTRVYLKTGGAWVGIL